MRDIAEFYGVDFEHRTPSPVQRKRLRSRRGVLEAVEEHDIELVVLARYMQILSPELCEAACRSGDQHSPLVPPGLQGREPLQAGASARASSSSAQPHTSSPLISTRARSSSRTSPAWITPTRRASSSSSARTSSRGCSVTPSAGSLRTECCRTAIAQSSSGSRVRVWSRFRISQLLSTSPHSLGFDGVFNRCVRCGSLTHCCDVSLKTRYNRSWSQEVIVGEHR